MLCVYKLLFLWGFVHPEAMFVSRPLADWISGLLGDQECPGPLNKSSNVAKLASCIEFWLFLWFLLPQLWLFPPSWWEVVLKDFSKPCKVIPISIEPLHLLWMKSALHPSLGPPTDASCSCMLLPVSTQSLLSEDIATAKLGHRLNLNVAALNEATLVGWQDVQVSMVLFLMCNQRI